MKSQNQIATQHFLLSLDLSRDLTIHAKHHAWISKGSMFTPFAQAHETKEPVTIKYASFLLTYKR